MNKPLVYALTALVFFLIALFAAIIVLDFLGPSTGKVFVNGIEFSAAADASAPNAAAALNALGSEQKFMVSPQFFESGAANEQMTKSLTLFTSILTFNGKNVETVARVVDANLSLLFCQSNEGDARQNNKISIEECEQKLAASDAVKILVALPNKNLPNAKVLVSADSIEVSPKEWVDVSNASFETLNLMYEGSSETVAKINSILSQIKAN
ncbi:MAG: hypothetical protein V1494_00730 [Candidatus Diapherotrites archaeon]